MSTTPPRGGFPTGPPEVPGPPQPPQPPSPPGQLVPQFGYAHPGPVVVGTNGFAIASLVCAFLCWPLGLIFGFIARSQIRNTHEGGGGLATAGIVISFVLLVLTVVYLVLVIAVLHSVTHGFNNFNIVVPTPAT